MAGPLGTQALTTQISLISRVLITRTSVGPKESQKLNGWHWSWPGSWGCWPLSFSMSFSGFLSDVIFWIFVSFSPHSTSCFGIFFLLRQILSLLDYQNNHQMKRRRLIKCSDFIWNTTIHRAMLCYHNECFHLLLEVGQGVMDVCLFLCKVIFMIFSPIFPSFSVHCSC